MIRIIDATLSVLDNYNLTREKIYTFIDLIGGIGINNIQISIKTYNILNGELPDGFNYYLEVDTASYLNNEFPYNDEKIKVIFSPKRKSRDIEIPTYHINNLEEPFRMENPKEMIKVIGLDDLILGGVDIGFDALGKRFDLKKMIFCPENTYSCATAMGVIFLQKKGYAAVSTMFGTGNKAATEQMLLSLHVNDRFLSKNNFEKLPLLRDFIEEITEKEMSPMTPVVGRRIFYVESGVHVDGILKKPTNYEPYEPELVGLSREVSLGKHSGKNSLKYKIEQLRLEIGSDIDMDELLAEVKQISRISGKSISNDDFIKIVEGFERNEKTN